MRLRASCLFGSLLALALPATALGAEVGGFSVRPARFDPRDPITRAYFKHTVRPAGRFGAAVLVTNSRDTPIDLHVDAVDGLTGRTSGAVFANRGVPVRETGRWVVLQRREITVLPHAHTTVGFGVHVPANATAGDHLAGIAIEDAHPITSGKRFTIREVVRAVVGVDVRVTGPAAAALQLRGASLQPLPGTRMSSVVLGLRNTGALLCKPRLTVTLDGDGGARTVTRRLDTLLPGDRIPYPMAWPQALGKGTYAVRARASGCGPATKMSTTASLARPLAPAGHAAPAVAAPKPVPGGSSWWAIGAVGFGGVGAGIGATALRARVRPRRAAG